MPYIGNTIRAADDYRLIDDISSSFNGSTTSFALQVAGSAPVPFPKSPQQVLVSVNGVIQEPDPTGASGFNLVGTNIVFSSAPTNGHAFFGIIYATADYLNSGGNFPSGSLGAPSITFIGDENSGLYRKSGGSVGFVSDATEIANFDSNGITISSGNLILGDSSGANDDRIKLGASGDLELFHDGSNSYISDAGTGDLIITGTVIRPRTDQFTLTNAAANEVMIQGVANGAVSLYYDASKKFETTSSGVTVSGNNSTGSILKGVTRFTPNDSTTVKAMWDEGGFSGAGHFQVKDGVAFTAGNSSDLKIYHDGSHSHINNTTGNLLIGTDGEFQVLNYQENEYRIRAHNNGGVDLYYDHSKKFSTINAGAYVTGSFGVGAATNPSHHYNQGIHVHAAGDGAVLHLTDNTTGSAAGDGFDILTTSGEAYLWQRENSNMFFGTNGTSRWQIYGSNGHFVPSANNTYDIGTTSNRVGNIYTNDLNLSNEGGANDVDGTWGSYTIQEGVEDLFLVNRRNGKKYKFNLTEVS